MFRLAHLTDIHFRTLPRFSELTLKRVFGLINQYAYGRKDLFSLRTQQQAVQLVRRLKVDAAVITGDLTAMGLGTR
jgi:3',5'-cyclic AMP phosphodiesterase CpdA